MNPFLLPLQIQMSLVGLTFQVASAMMQAQAPLFRLAVPGALMPVTLKAGCGGIVAR